MRGLADFIMAGRIQAVTAAVGFAVLALVLPPVALLSGAAVALVTLRLGLAAGAGVALLSGLALTILGWVTAGVPQLGLLFALGQWLAPLLFAELLRRTVSWRLTLQALLLLTLGLLLLAQLLWPEMTATWREALTEGMAPLLAEGGMPPAQIDEVLDRLAELMNAVLAVAMMLGTAFMLVIGRYWQAALYNPGGFGEEFRALRLGRWPAGLVIGLVLGMLLLDSRLLGQLALVTAAIFLLQGLALAHGLARLYKWHMGWMVALYVLLLLPPFSTYAVAMLSAFGVIDCFADFRARAGAGARGNE